MFKRHHRGVQNVGAYIDTSENEAAFCYFTDEFVVVEGGGQASIGDTIRRNNMQRSKIDACVSYDAYIPQHVTGISGATDDEFRSSIKITLMGSNLSPSQEKMVENGLVDFYPLKTPKADENYYMSALLALSSYEEVHAIFNAAKARADIITIPDMAISTLLSLQADDDAPHVGVVLNHDRIHIVVHYHGMIYFSQQKTSLTMMSVFNADNQKDLALLINRCINHLQSTHRLNKPSRVSFFADSKYRADVRHLCESLKSKVDVPLGLFDFSYVQNLRSEPQTLAGQMALGMAYYSMSRHVGGGEKPELFQLINFKTSYKVNRLFSLTRDKLSFSTSVKQKIILWGIAATGALVVAGYHFNIGLPYDKDMAPQIPPSLQLDPLNVKERMTGVDTGGMSELLPQKKLLPMMSVVDLIEYVTLYPEENQLKMVVRGVDFTEGSLVIMLDSPPEEEKAIFTLVKAISTKAHFTHPFTLTEFSIDRQEVNNQTKLIYRIMLMKEVSSPAPSAGFSFVEKTE